MKKSEGVFILVFMVLTLLSLAWLWKENRRLNNDLECIRADLKVYGMMKNEKILHAGWRGEHGIREGD